MPFFTSLTGGRREPDAQASGSSRDRLRQTTLKFTRNQGATPVAFGAMFHAGKQGTDDAGAAMLASATMFGDIINVIPIAYREVLQRPLRELSELAGTWPPLLQGIHLPKVEVTAGYLATAPGLIAMMKTEYDEYRTLALDRAIKLKSAELMWLQNQLDAQVYLPPLSLKIRDQWTEIEKIVRRPVFGRNGDGQVTLDSFVESPAAKAEFDHLITDLPVFCSRIILIENTRYHAKRIKRDDKHKLKADADVEMGEITTSGTAIADIVNKKLSAALKKLSIKVSNDLAEQIDTLTNPLSTGKRIWSEFQSQETRKRQRIEGEGSSHGDSHQHLQGEGQGEGLTTPTRQREEAAEAQEWIEKIVRSYRLAYGSPNTYPDELLLIPRPLAI
jgi:hypothetical protein